MSPAPGSSSSEESIRLSQEALKTLEGAPEFRALEHYRPPFSPLRTLGVEHRELSHSAFLRFMLDPSESHGLGARFLCRFLEQVDPDMANEVSKIDPQSVTVRLEYERIDVFVDCGAGGPVVGIEVKVWAGEGWKQIERYQQLMVERYRDRPAIFVFLTPEGRKAETARVDSPIRCIPLSWLEIDDLLHQESRYCGDVGVAAFMIQFGRHLRDMINGDSEERKLVSKLFKSPKKGRAALRIAKVREQLFSQGVVQALVRRISSLLEQDGVEIETENWSSNQSKEVQLRLVSNGWRKIPLVFLFYDYPQDPSFGTGMHVLLGGDSSGFNTRCYQEALAAEYSGKEAADCMKPPPGWFGGWQLALPSDLYGKDERLGWRFVDESFDEGWIEMAANKFEEAYELVKPVVEHYLEKNV